MSALHDVVGAIRIRQQTQWVWDCVSRGLAFGGLIGIALAIVTLAGWYSVPFHWLFGVVLAGPVLGLLVALSSYKSMRHAAKSIDSSCGLKDRTTTAMQFLELGDAMTPLQQMQVADTKRHLDKVDPVTVAKFSPPSSMIWGMMAVVLAFVLAMIPYYQKESMASSEPNEVLVTQASRVDSELEELRELQQEQKDPEIEKLLKELNAKLEELKDPALAPKEALAKLSEMEASIQAMQKDLNETQSEAALKEIGEALTLSESMSTAGAALSKGDMEKAAEELAKMEMPELDRKTEKSISEKLANMKNKDGMAKNKKLQEASDKLCEGMCNGDSSKFQEGKEGLASECKKQGTRKKLSDLLRKQCQCLGECKSECESECKNTAMSKKKGGNKAGLASSGNELGDKTAMLSSNNKMNITGQESSEGEVDIETEKAQESEQKAVRDYRQNADKYEALKESALESESIPLGHRQTIRKYFEMIRPSNNASAESSSETGSTGK
jgi:hypothetical protein